MWNMTLAIPLSLLYASCHLPVRSLSASSTKALSPLTQCKDTTAPPTDPSPGRAFDHPSAVARNVKPRRPDCPRFCGA